MEYFTWEDFDKTIKDIASVIRYKELKVDYIFGIPRGGLVVAVALSHQLNRPFISHVGEPNTLIVDDISDTGKTLERMKPFVDMTATIHIGPNTTFVPTVWVHKKTSDWIVYPWEVKTP